MRRDWRKMSVQDKVKLFILTVESYLLEALVSFAWFVLVTCHGRTIGKALVSPDFYKDVAKSFFLKPA